MEISADTRTELEGLLAELMNGDAQAVDLPTCNRRLGFCQRLSSFSAAVEAELLPIQRRLLAEDARLAAARAAADAADRDGDAGDAGGEAPHDGGAMGPDGLPDHGAADRGAAGQTGANGAGGDQTESPSSDSPGDGSAAPGGESPPPPRPRESPRARQQRELRSKWLNFYPGLAEALAAGRITPEHVDALAGVFERTPPVIVAEFHEPWLVATAETYPPEGFASFLRDEINRIRDDGGESEYARQVNDSWAWMGIDRTTGMYLLKLGIDPHRGAQLQSAIDQRVTQLRNQPGSEKLRYSQLFLQAILDLVLGDVQIVPDSLVVVDHQTTQTGWHPATVCENIDGVPLPVSLALAACATGNVTAAIIDSTGKVVDYGCSSALADKKQHKLQRGMYRSCAHPDCSVPYSRCEIHHVTYRQHGGTTIMSNLVPLCFEHHHQLHDHGWTLTIDDDRTLRWYQPDGTPTHVTHLTRLDHRDTTNVASPIAAEDHTGTAWPIRNEPPSASPLPIPAPAPADATDAPPAEARPTAQPGDEPNSGPPGDPPAPAVLPEHDTNSGPHGESPPGEAGDGPPDEPPRRFDPKAA